MLLHINKMEMSAREKNTEGEDKGDWKTWDMVVVGGLFQMLLFYME